MDGLSVKKKGEISLRKTVAFAVVSTDSSYDSCGWKLVYLQTPPSQAPQLLLFRNWGSLRRRSLC